MTSLAGQILAPQLPERLRQRVEALGITLVVANANGQVTPQDHVQWLERLIVRAAPFAAAVRSRWPQLLASPGQVVDVWPGVWLVPLPEQRRRRAGDPKSQPQILAALLLGHEFLQSDEMRLVCDTQQLDFQATVARVLRSQQGTEPSSQQASEEGKNENSPFDGLMASGSMTSSPSGLVTLVEARRLAATLAWMQQDSLEIDRRFGELQAMSTQLGESYEELSLLYKLSTSLTIDQPPAAFLQEASRELRQVVGLQWMGLQLDEEEPRLNELRGGLFTAGEIGADSERLKQVGTRLLRLPSTAVQPLIVDDTSKLDIPHLPQLARELLVVPMLREGKSLGILFGGNKLDGSHITSIDTKLCGSLANSLGIFLENRMLFEDMTAMFMGTLHALTASIDAKDRYTKGHSERVAIMSRRLAAAAGLNPDAVERVYISGLVHDVGKIGVPEAVLCKPGRLTTEEFALIKLHPEIGARILRDIRQMSDLIPGVLYHHERWDGKGYPYGLAGTDIPLYGRLICLADSFDAMSSNRTYRKSLQLESVLDEIRRCAGTQFDPELAQLFVKLDFTDFFKMLEDHQKQAESADGKAQIPTAETQ